MGGSTYLDYKRLSPSNLDSMLHTFKMKQGAFRGDTPQVEEPVPAAETKTLVVKFRKGAALLRYKLKVVGNSAIRCQKLRVTTVLVYLNFISAEVAL